MKKRCTCFRLKKDGQKIGQRGPRLRGAPQKTTAPSLGSIELLFCYQPGKLVEIMHLLWYEFKKITMWGTKWFTYQHLNHYMSPLPNGAFGNSTKIHEIRRTFGGDNSTFAESSWTPWTPRRLGHEEKPGGLTHATWPYQRTPCRETQKLGKWIWIKSSANNLNKSQNTPPPFTSVLKILNPALKEISWHLLPLL